jgi:hypothetical protein
LPRRAAGRVVALTSREFYPARTSLAATISTGCSVSSPPAGAWRSGGDAGGGGGRGGRHVERGGSRKREPGQRGPDHRGGEDPSRDEAPRETVLADVEDERGAECRYVDDSSRAPAFPGSRRCPATMARPTAGASIAGSTLRPHMLLPGRSPAQGRSVPAAGTIRPFDTDTTNGKSLMGEAGRSCQHGPKEPSHRLTTRAMLSVPAPEGSRCTPGLATVHQQGRDLDKRCLRSVALPRRSV